MPPSLSGIGGCAYFRGCCSKWPQTSSNRSGSPHSSRRQESETCHRTEIKARAGPCCHQRLSAWDRSWPPPDALWLVATSLRSLPLSSFLCGSASSSLRTPGTYKSLDLGPNRNRDDFILRFLTNDTYKDLISKSGHILRFWMDMSF